MFLDKKSEKILSIVLSKYGGNMDEDIDIFPNELEMDYSELNSACKSLKELGFLRFFIYSNFHTEPVCLRLSHKGLHYFEFKRAENLRLLKNSVFLPVIVTLLTQLIVFLLKLLLPLILQWLSHTP